MGVESECIDVQVQRGNGTRFGGRVALQVASGIDRSSKCRTRVLRIKTSRPINDGWEKTYASPKVYSFHYQPVDPRQLSLAIQVMPPVSVITSALLSSIRGQPHLPRHAWYLVTGVTLSVLNLPHEIPTVFKHAIEYGPGSCDTKPGHDEQLEIARKMRDALVKAAPIGGLPKVSRHMMSSVCLSRR